MYPKFMEYRRKYEYKPTLIKLRGKIRINSIQ